MTIRWCTNSFFYNINYISLIWIYSFNDYSWLLHAQYIVLKTSCDLHITSRQHICLILCVLHHHQLIASHNSWGMPSSSMAEFFLSYLCTYTIANTPENEQITLGRLEIMGYFPNRLSRNLRTHNLMGWAAVNVLLTTVLRRSLKLSLTSSTWKGMLMWTGQFSTDSHRFCCYLLWYLTEYAG